MLERAACDQRAPRRARARRARRRARRRAPDAHARATAPQRAGRLCAPVRRGGGRGAPAPIRGVRPRARHGARPGGADRDGRARPAGIVRARQGGGRRRRGHPRRGSSTTRSWRIGSRMRASWSCSACRARPRVVPPWPSSSPMRRARRERTSRRALRSATSSITRHGARCDAPPGSTHRPSPERLHAVRKAGRRLRYAAEAVTEEPVVLFGKRARALAGAGEELHDVLGDHRDELLFAEHVRRVAAHAGHAGAPVDALERLAVDADDRAAERLAQLDPAVRGAAARETEVGGIPLSAAGTRQSRRRRCMIARSAFGRATSLNPAFSNIVTVPWKRSAAGASRGRPGRPRTPSRRRAPCWRGVLDRGLGEGADRRPRRYARGTTKHVTDQMDGSSKSGSGVPPATMRLLRRRRGRRAARPRTSPPGCRRRRRGAPAPSIAGGDLRLEAVVQRLVADRRQSLPGILYHWHQQCAGSPFVPNTASTSSNGASPAGTMRSGPDWGVVGRRGLSYLHASAGGRHPLGSMQTARAGIS